MAKEELIVIKEAQLTNNCPECFNQDMHLTFLQKHLHSRFFHRITSKVTHEIRCNKCRSLIYPVNWDEGIEKIFDYYQKQVEPAKPTLRLSKLSLILVIIVLLLIAAGIYLYSEGIIQF